MTKTQKYLKTFFEEKNLPHASWEIEASDGRTHVIDNEVVIEHILRAAPDSEQINIAAVIRRIDFLNGDVNHFLRHLAGALVENFPKEPSWDPRSTGCGW